MSLAVSPPPAAASTAPQVYASGDKSVLTPDVGGTGTQKTFTDALLKHL